MEEIEQLYDEWIAECNKEGEAAMVSQLQIPIVPEALWDDELMEVADEELLHHVEGMLNM